MNLNNPQFVPLMNRWFIRGDHLNRIKALAASMQSDKMTPLQAAPRILRRRGESAYVPIKGVLLPSETEAALWRKYGLEATGYDEIRSMLTAAISDPTVKTVVLEIDSPGGTVQGTIETADAIWNARQNSGKSVVALIEEMACSSGYYMASQTEQIVAGPNSEIGCIGTMGMMYDISKFYEMIGVRAVVIKSGEFKGAGAEGTVITEDQIQMYQPVIDGMAENFKRDVARGRGMTLDQVNPMANGAIWLAPEAMTRKLIDRITRTNTFDGVTEMELTEQDKKKIAADAAADARKLMADLSREFPEDPQFAQEQFAKGATVTEAKAAYADKLKARLAESQAAQDQLKTDLDKAKAQATASTKTTTKTAQGCQPIPAGGSEPADGSKDFVAMARERAKERNTTVTDAMKELAKMDPAGHSKWVDSQGPLPVL